MYFFSVKMLKQEYLKEKCHKMNTLQEHTISLKQIQIMTPS